MDELSEEDKLVVAREEKFKDSCLQPFFVAEVFTGSPGKYVPLKILLKVLKVLSMVSMTIFQSKHFI